MPQKIDKSVRVQVYNEIADKLNFFRYDLQPIYFKHSSLFDIDTMLSINYIRGLIEEQIDLF